MRRVNVKWTRYYSIEAPNDQARKLCKDAILYDIDFLDWSLSYQELFTTMKRETPSILHTFMKQANIRKKTLDQIIQALDHAVIAQRIKKNREFEELTLQAQAALPSAPLPPPPPAPENIDPVLDAIKALDAKVTHLVEILEKIEKS